MKAVVVTKNGGVESLQLRELERPVPKRGEVLVKVDTAGVNFIDIYYRQGAYPMDVPFVAGVEGAGVIEEINLDADIKFQVGDRVAWCMVPDGSYATHAIVPAKRLVKVPESISLETAASVMLQGVTAHFLSSSMREIEAGAKVLVHAGAGGVGLLLTQMLASRGVKVITTVSTQEKLEKSTAAGASMVINYQDDNFKKQIEEKFGPRPIDVVFDGVGRATFQAGLQLIKNRGMMVLYGAASGPVAPVDPQELNTNGSLFLTRPSISHYIEDQTEYAGRCTALFDSLASNALNVTIANRYSLLSASDAQRDLESRAAIGKLLITI